MSTITKDNPCFKNINSYKCDENMLQRVYEFIKQSSYMCPNNSQCVFTNITNVNKCLKIGIECIKRYLSIISIIKKLMYKYNSLKTNNYC